VIENDGMQMNNNVGDIDESTFILWKNELQKELPSFWEIMQRF
jgi:hypothetical protein